MSFKHAETAAKAARKLIERRRQLVLEVSADPHNLESMDELYQLQETIDLLRRIAEDEKGVFRLTELVKETAQDNNRNAIPRDAVT
jgi:Txe/YoeB family toxin of Txe-Axe toxin-antitoxin module